jgi:hypothetical protein
MQPVLAIDSMSIGISTGIFGKGRPRLSFAHGCCFYLTCGCNAFKVCRCYV